MRKTKIPLVVISCLFLLVSYQKEEDPRFFKAHVVQELEGQQVLLEITDAVVQTLENNYYNTSDIKVVDFMLPDGTFESRFQVEKDITFSATSLNALPGTKKNVGAESRYYANNLVSPGTLTIIGFTGGANALSNRERTALKFAVNNYNRLNLSIRFCLTFGANYQNRDMVIYNNPNESGSGGAAGFPSNGNPNKFVQIYGLRSASVDVIEHVITHQIGHSVGLRHADWFARQSCGDNSSESVRAVDAKPILGAALSYDATSVMRSCFSSTEDGEFNSNDIRTLRYLY